MDKNYDNNIAITDVFASFELVGLRIRCEIHDSHNLHGRAFLIRIRTEYAAVTVFRSHGISTVPAFIIDKTTI